MDLKRVVEAFEQNVLAQADAIARGDHTAGNRHARQYIEAFDKLRSLGDTGREALVPLFVHPRAEVRVMAATFLLRHRTNEAKAVLEAAAAETKGITRLGASQALKRWEEGTWELDPA